MQRRSSIFAVLAGLLVTASVRGDESLFSDKDRDWWAIRPVTDPDIPTIGGAALPVDAFVQRKLAARGLQLAPAAGAAEFIRRATFDLHGLPPAPERIASFRTAWQENPDAAVTTLVDELLASPRYGERWAQHWLDVVRFAESDGYREDGFRPEAFHYRDYVIRAFNEDRPYDRFVREQLAADEFPETAAEDIVATGFLRHGIYEWNQRDAEMQRGLIVNEITNVTGEVFLGIGIGCARCHDHKFDPILQRDYFALQAFLSSTIWPESQPLGTASELAEHREKQTAWELATKEIRSELDEILRQARERVTRSAVDRFPENVQAMYWKPEAERSAYEQQIAMLVQRQVDRDVDKINEEGDAKKNGKLERYQELTAQLAGYDSIKPKPLPAAFVSTDAGTRPAMTFMGDGADKTEVAPGYLSLLGQTPPEIVPTDHSTGRRRALADWIVAPDNPFAPRVLANRIWQHHFGRGLVATPNDFGTLGEPPSHPELLDWLAGRLLDGGWKIKPLHRAIMNSAAYRQTARREPGDAERTADPENRLLWRFPPTRLSAEQVRDAMLAVSGELKPRDGGPSVDGDAPFRSVFVKKLRNTPDKVLQCFDAPSGFDSAPDRQTTTTPTQALLLANSDWPMERARAFARRLLGSRRDVRPADVVTACELAWGRSPSEAEITLALDFIEAQKGEASRSRPPQPTLRFPKETGLRPIAQNFAAAIGDGEVELGSRALWLQPTSRFERLHLGATTLESDAFTIEAIVQLDAIHKDASVNTLVSQWNGSPTSRGWSFGVTSEKSRFKPRHLIVQLTGENPGGDVEYEVVDSGLIVPTGRPVYVAASVEPRPDGKGKVRFFARDLSMAGAPLQDVTVAHNIASHIRNPDAKLLLGGRDDAKNGHLWDGQLARIAITPGTVAPDRLLITNAEKRPVDFVFSGDNGELPLPESAWLRSQKPPPLRIDPTLEAVADFCHALLSSNEFLYLH